MPFNWEWDLADTVEVLTSHWHLKVFRVSGFENDRLESGLILWWTDFMLGFVVLRQFFKNKKRSFACHVFPAVKKRNRNLKLARLYCTK